MSSRSQLKLAAVSFNGEAVSPDAASCEFWSNEKITLGRNGSNNLVLDDPSRVISRVQASLSPKDPSSMHIVNLSASTSIFVNAQELLPGERGVLSCNDSLMVGAYVLQLSANNFEDNNLASISSRFFENPAATPGYIPEDADFFSVNNSGVSEPTSTAGDEYCFVSDGGLLQSESQSTDFLLDQLLAKKTVTEFTVGTESVGSSVVVSPDELVDSLSSLLVEKNDFPIFSSNRDRSLEIESLFVVPRPVATQPMGLEVCATEHPVADSQRVFPQSPESVEAGVRASDDDCRMALARALQLDIHKLPAFTPAFFERLGGVLLHLTAGTVNMMHGRAQVKHEMRADVTIIAASGNNPLKFAPDAQSAIAHLLGDPVPGFLRAKEAIDDAVDDLLAHQIGLVSGARAAVYEVMKNFSPERMQKYLATKNIIDSLLPMAKRSKLWELYEAHYAELAGNAREEFELRFQQAFAQAYEQEIDKMCAGREAV
ncbi:type VI secretion system-associated FHA domain protein TagH [Cellvibrio sp. KY-GH-1]|uniref:type VI secretion system-associated FHA domain protein TagH n=1 Tax=Cellvibrio sp. KY-GH-1 TaxID=2303332 RepID=UPI001785F05A|nr:type VI secretion system-associated FHA domain protein TagH [Cellvibrio sp. KY-GH-1]